MTSASRCDSGGTTAGGKADTFEVGGRLLGHFRLEQFLERGDDTMLYLADNEERGELVLLAFALSPGALAACLEGEAAGTVLSRAAHGPWHIAEVRLRESHLYNFADRLLTAPIDAITASTLRSPRGKVAASLADGSVFAGRYRVDGLLGRGGMGEVYRAYDTTLGRAVALKLVRVGASEGESNPEAAKRRLLNEARLVSVLEHPHIVAIHDAGESAGLPYLVLELCEGGSLRGAASKGAGRDDLLRWLGEVAEALSHAHEHGVVHRDVKPENVLLTADGAAKVADFGIAKALWGGLAQDGNTAGPVGTPAYMAPEQLFGRRVDARADQFAWGLMGYELLTGSHPRAGRGEVPRIERLAASAPGMTAHLLRVLSRAMAGEPEARYPDFRALLTDLRARPRRLRWQAAPLAACLALAAVGAGAAGLRAAYKGREAGRTLEAGAPSARAFGGEGQGAPPAPAPGPAALAHFNAGVQLLRDMSHKGAQARFSEATRAEPSFARAHLYCVLSALGGQSEASRLHYRSAHEHRASLGETDARLLDALGPAMQDPLDLVEAERRLTRLFESSRGFFVASALASLRLRLDRPRDALDAVMRIDGPEKSPAFEAEMRAWVAVAEYRTADAKRAFVECVERSPGAGTCLRALTMLEANDGSCEGAEAGSRQWIAAWPNNADAYQRLAGALYGRTRSVESARAALERAWALVPEAERPLERAASTTYLDLLDGDVEGARRDLDEWERLASASPDAFTLGLPASVRLDLEYELSPPERTRALAKRYLARSAAWSDNPNIDFRVTAARTLLRTGGMTEDELARERGAWLTTSTQGAYAIDTMRWFNFYATVAATPRLAADAVRRLPAERPFFDPFMCDNDCEATIGEAFFVAGEFDRALSHLGRAAGACTVMYPLQSLRARHLLGRTLESLGRPAEACDAYRRILEQWPRVRESRVVRHATSRSAALGCGRPAPRP